MNKVTRIDLRKANWSVGKNLNGIQTRTCRPLSVLQLLMSQSVLRYGIIPFQVQNWVFVPVKFHDTANIPV